MLPLEQCYRRSLERHREAAQRGSWTYTDFLPQGVPGAARLSEVAQAAVEIALLTEVNLPWYTAYLAGQLPANCEALRSFLHIWTAEEDQHATLLESYLLVTRSGDAAARAALRKATILTGFDPTFPGPFPIAVYTALQEVQTRAFYLRAATAVGGETPMLAHAFRRLARDETLHANFYRDAVAAHLEADPDYVFMLARTMLQFRMPGYVQPGYEQRSEFATRNLFGAAHFLADVIDFAWSTWRLDEIQPEHPAAQAELRRLRRWRAAFSRIATRESAARRPAASQ